MGGKIYLLLLNPYILYMPTLKVTEDQLRLIQRSLDLYSRIGIGQMWAILDHPTFYNVLTQKLRPQKDLEIGDQTERGEIVEIGEDYIKTKGVWDGKEEIRTWTDVENIKLSIDYNQYHDIRKEGKNLLDKGRNVLLQEDLPENASFGIYSSDVDESCRVAFDILQVIRHEFWKEDPDKSPHTVDSSVHLSTKDSDQIKCNLKNNSENNKLS